MRNHFQKHATNKNKERKKNINEAEATSDLF